MAQHQHQPQQPPRPTVSLAIEGMMCMKNCGSTVRAALEGVPGVARADVSLEDGGRVVVHLSGPGAASVEALVDAVDAVGFGAAPLQEEDFQAIDLASPAPVPAPASDPTGAPPDVTLAIEGMMCQKNCGSTVQRALGGVPGVAAARVSFDEGQAWVWLRPSPEAPTVQMLVDAVEAVGFGAEPASASSAAASQKACPLRRPTGAEADDETKACSSLGSGPGLPVTGRTLSPTRKPLLGAEDEGEEENGGGSGSGGGHAWAWGSGRAGSSKRQRPRPFSGFFGGGDDGTAGHPQEEEEQQWEAEEGAGGGAAARGAPSRYSHKATFAVSGMTCAACVGRVERAIVESAQLPPGAVRGAKVALLTETAEVLFDPTLTSAAAIEAAVQGAGYRCRHLKTDVAAPSKKQGTSGFHGQQFTLAVGGMSCAACSGKIERVVSAMPGVQACAVSLSTQMAKVTLAAEASYSPSRPGRGRDRGREQHQAGTATTAATTGIRDVIARVEALGYEARLLETADAMGQIAGLTQRQAEETAAWLRYFLVSCCLTLPMMLVMWFAPNSALDALHRPWQCGGRLDLMSFISFLTTTPVQAYVGRRFYVNAYKGLRHGNYGMDLLVALGTSTAYGYSLLALVYACGWPHPAAASDAMPAHHHMDDMSTPTHSHQHSLSHFFFDTAAMLLTFVSLGKYLESRVKGQTSRALTVLAGLQPKSALLLPNYDARASLSEEAKEQEQEQEQEQPVDIREQQEIALSLVKAGDVLRVLPGASVPTDGVVLEGQSYVGEAMLTGEAMPVHKGPGDAVLGGTINQHGAFLMRATSVGADTALSQILTLVQEAQLSKPPIQRYADRLASYFTPAVMSVASAAFLLWWLAGRLHAIPAAWLTEDDRAQSPLVFALTVWISVITVACPCALGLATPTAVMVGTGVGARLGILIKGGDAFQAAHSVTAVVLDKTGTLTTGKAVVTDEVPLLPEAEAVAAVAAMAASGSGSGRGKASSGSGSGVGRARDELLALAAAVEQGSEHPVAQAILRQAKSRGLCVPHALDFEVVPGLGIAARVAPAKETTTTTTTTSSSSSSGSGWLRVAVGNRRYMEEVEGLSCLTLSAAAATSNAPALRALMPPPSTRGSRGGGGGGDEDEEAEQLHRPALLLLSAADARAALEEGGKTVVYVSVARRLVGMIAVADKPRPEARDTVAALHRMGIEVWMLTGDSSAAAHAVARSLGIDPHRVHAGTLPGHKAKRVKALQAQGHVVAMVGDGINDSPALAQADVGVAIGAGAQVACEAADMVMVRNRLDDVVTALHLARTVFRRIKLNFLWAMGYNALGIPFAAGLFLPVLHWRLPPGYSGLAMVLSSLSVVVSSLALNAYRRPALHRVGGSRLQASRFRTSSEARRRVSQLRPFLHPRTSSASASPSGNGRGHGDSAEGDGDVELGAVTIAQGRRHQHQHRRSRSQPAAGAGATSARRGSAGSVDSLGSLASSLGSAAGGDEAAAAGGGLGALGALAALDLDASSGTSALSRLWQGWRGYRNLPPEQVATRGRVPAATLDVQAGEDAPYLDGGRGRGRVSVSSHRETV